MSFVCDNCGNLIADAPLKPCEKCDGQVWINDEVENHPNSVEYVDER